MAKKFSPRETKDCECHRWQGFFLSPKETTHPYHVNRHILTHLGLVSVLEFKNLTAGVGSAVQWYSTCIAHTGRWVWSLVLQKNYKTINLIVEAHQTGNIDMRQQDKNNSRLDVEGHKLVKVLSLTFSNSNNHITQFLYSSQTRWAILKWDPRRSTHRKQYHHYKVDLVPSENLLHNSLP